MLNAGRITIVTIADPDLLAATLTMAKLKRVVGARDGIRRYHEGRTDFQGNGLTTSAQAMDVQIRCFVEPQAAEKALRGMYGTDQRQQ